jgi:hypothetical protein
LADGQGRIAGKTNARSKAPALCAAKVLDFDTWQQRVSRLICPGTLQLGAP